MVCTIQKAIFIAAAVWIAASCGVLAKSAHEKVLYSFCSQSGCVDGVYPPGGLALDKHGVLFGTANGGLHGSGVVFKLTPDGTQTLLHIFCSENGCTDGQSPNPDLFIDRSGNLYGTTTRGGTNACGTVYKLSPDGTETVLYNFCSQANGIDGVNPWEGVIADDAGNLYGTTGIGGTVGTGTVFKLAPDGTETVLHSFCSIKDCRDGNSPTSKLTIDASGNLYGTTNSGGKNNKGVIFKVAPDGSETVLYSFCSRPRCLDGAGPVGNPVIVDGDGFILGATYGGGKNGDGVLYKLAPDGTQTIIHDFCHKSGCPDGTTPMGSMIMDGAGNLFGTADGGGVYGHGVAFKLAPDGTETVLHAFCADAQVCSDGSGPAGLVAGSNGKFYGTTAFGGSSDSGTVFEITNRR